jgi:tetratricopeptide (TPR) repeat protein
MLMKRLTLAVAALALWTAPGATAPLSSSPSAPPPVPDEPSAPAAIGKAIEALRKGDADTAVRIARRFIVDQPNAAVGHEVLGAALAIKRSYPEAERELEEALKLDPGRATAMLRLGLVAIEQKDPKRAEDWFRKALAQAPGLADARRGLAVSLLRQGRIEQAVAVAREGVEQSGGQDPEAKYLLATVYHEIGRPAEAEPLLTQVLAGKPDLQPALLLQGIVKLELGKVDDAAVLLQKASDRAPRSLWARLGLAVVKRVRGQLDQSRAELEGVIKDQPDWALAHLQLGQTLWLEAKHEAAIRAFDQAEKTSPNAVLMRLRVAQFFLSQGDIDRSIARAQGSLGTPVAPLARGFLAQAYLVKRQPDLAQRELEAAAAESPQDPMWPLQLGRLQLSLGKAQEALVQFVSAAKLSPRAPDALAGQAQAYLALNQPADAIKAAQAALKVHNESAEAYLFLGSVYDRVGQSTDAAQAYQKALERQPAHIGASLALAGLYNRTGRAGDAVKLLEDAANANPASALPLLDLAQIHLKAGNESATIGAYRQVLARDPNNPLAFNNLAYFLGKNPARIDEALEFAERAYRAAPRSPAVADTLGWLLYQKGGALDRAETLLSQAAAGVPNDREVHYHLGMVLAKQGKKEEARRELEQALQSPGFPGTDEARRTLESIR